MSGRGAAVAACTKPGVLAVLSMDDSLLALDALKQIQIAEGKSTVPNTLGYYATRQTIQIARASLAALHGEPNDMDRARWKALNADEKREALEASKRKVLRP